MFKCKYITPSLTPHPPPSTLPPQTRTRRSLALKIIDVACSCLASMPSTLLFPVSKFLFFLCAHSFCCFLSCCLVLSLDISRFLFLFFTRLTYSFMHDLTDSSVDSNYVHLRLLCHRFVVPRVRYNTFQHAATHCNTLQHTATHCNTLQHAATRCNTLQNIATHCNTLQHAATHCNTLQYTATHRNILQHTPTHFNASQHTTPTATHCNT